MVPVVLLAVWLRRTARVLAPTVCALLLAALVVLDASTGVPFAYAVGVAGALAFLVAVRLAKRATAIDGSLRADIELGLFLVVAATGTAAHLDASLDGHSYALVYVAVCLISAFARPLASMTAVVFSVGLELAIRIWGFGEALPVRALMHAGFLLFFAALHMVVLRCEVARVRRATRTHLETEAARLRDEARSYRLLGATSTRADSRRGDEDRLTRSGVEEIHQSVLFALRLLRESLHLTTAMLLWQNDDGTHLRISELASDASNLSEGPFLIGDGIFGAVMSQRGAVEISGPRVGARLPYYVGPSVVNAVLALPVFEHAALRGVLVVDRNSHSAFTPREQQLVEEASRYAVRAIQNERVFVQLERAKVEQGKLYRAAEALGSATTEASVIEAGVKSAREITSVDYAAVTLWDDAAKAHEIRAVSGDGSAELVGQRFRSNTGLVSMVLQNRHPLPYRGEYDAAHQAVFTRQLRPPPMPSIVVLPLLVHERPLGTLVLGSRRRAAFNEAARGTLEVLASHIAVSLANARMMRRLEELATMDGLTGLLNKRAMLEVAAQKITAGKRFGRHLSVVIADIDHFKKVNDTHGHDVGDIVIKGLAEILRRAKRNTDAVARFGGEEFVIICEETNARGGMLLAERVREELERTTFHVHGQSTPNSEGDLHVTCSLGVATFPEAGEHWETLFKAADDALYVSKRTGRNRTTAWTPGIGSVASPGADRFTAA
jgi:diguanylate cyclase (GGDEF)-like protein